ncbi:hypothetical protein AAVH_20278 [Aphelenchoides avenae]|nr:hypothetical protein AAVH_20278 [Aphelenchus avenae]
MLLQSAYSAPFSVLRKCAEAVRVFRGALQQWRHLFEAGLYSECYRALSNLRYDDIVTTVKHEAVRDTRSLMICAAEIETSAAEGRRYSEEVMSEIFGNEYWTSRSVHAYRLAQKINSQAAAIVCQLFGENETRSGRLNFAREQLSRAFTLYAGGDQDRRRECAVLLAFCNYFQVCRVKYRIEDDVEAFLGPEQCEELKELADALRKADAQRFAQLLQNAHLRFGNFMQDLLATLSTELTYALKAMGPAREFQASGKLDRLCTHIKNVHSMCSRTLWFDALRIQISAFVATAPAEVGRELRQIYEEGRELENCDETEVPALSVLHDSWGRECLRRQKFDAAERHFEKALRAYASNATATDFLGASFLAFTSLVNGETPSFDEAVVRFDRWLTNDAKVTLRRFYDAHKSEDMVTVEAVVANLKESKDMLASVAEHYASVLHNKLQLRQLGTNTNLAWTQVFDRLSHRDLHNVQLACRSFRSIARTRLLHTPFGPIVVGGHMASWRYEWGVQCSALRRDTDRAAIATGELVDRLEETCGSSPIPKLVIRGDAPLDHPQLLAYAAKHEVAELVLETDFSGLAYEPLRRFLHSWKSIDSLTVSTPNAADIVCVSDNLLRDAAACGIEKVSVRCEQAAGITDERILGFWLSATTRSLEVIRPAISQDFLRRLVQVCAGSEAHSEAELNVYTSPTDALRKLNWKGFFDCWKSADASGTAYVFATDGIVVELKISLNEHCRLGEGGPAREYDVLRVTRRRVDGSHSLLYRYQS